MKKLLAIILALIMLVNFCGAYTIHSSASFDTVAVTGVDDALIAYFGTMIIGLLAGMFAGGSGEALETYFNDPEQVERSKLNRINSSAFANGEVVRLTGRSSYGYRFEPVDDTDEFAVYLADYFNNSEDFQNICNKYMGTYDNNTFDEIIRTYVPWTPIHDINANDYKTIKTDATKAVAGYINQITKIENDIEGNEALFNADDISTYSFDFVGPVQGLRIPTKTGFMSSYIDGFDLMTPYLILRADGYFDSKEAATAAGANRIVERSDGSVMGFYDSAPVYGLGHYVIYNNKIYYRAYITHTSQAYAQKTNVSIEDSMLQYFVAADGEKLKDAGCTTFVGLYGGLYYCEDPDATTNYPVNAKEDDLTTTTGGGEVALPRTAAEDTIGEAMQLGLISTNPTLTLDDNGNITAADGIDLATLENLVKQLADSQIKFSDLKGYLEAIQTACQNTDLDEDEIKRLLKTVSDNMIDVDNLNKTLKGVKDSIDSQSDTLSKIESNTAAIAEALTAAGELEIERDSTELNAIIGEHTGLTEANEFVNRWTLIKQCKSIFENVLDPDRYLTNAPNFNFYFDSDNDGKVEKYTALDLSFLETTLTNDNLEDKGRFYKPMTVREFIQLLLIFVCWISFAMKLIRKLPGLISGGESSIDTGLEMANIDRANTLKSLKSLR